MQHRKLKMLSPQRRRERRVIQRLCGIFLFVFISIFSRAQSSQEIFIRTFTTHDSIMIRWVPATPALWKLGNQNGYIIERFLQSEYPNGNPTLISLSPIRPLLKTDTTWKQLMLADKLNAFVFENLYGEKSAGTNAEKKKLEEQVQFVFCLKAGDLSVTTAKAEGLYFCDKTISPGQAYVYRIHLANVPATLHPPAIAIADGKLSVLNVPENVRANFRNKKAAITFDISTTREQYAGYIIERSEDSISFTRVNSTLFTF